MHRSRSEAAFARAQGVLVGGVNSPVRAFGAVGGQPVFVARAEGAHVVDLDGRRYVDLVGSFGPAIVGHAHPEVLEAVTRAARDGLSFGACCESEAALAEAILSALPGHDKVRFVNSGTEAAMSVVRLARAATGRSKVIKFEGCYHGHVDALLVAAGSGAATLGVPDSAGVTAAMASQTLLAPFNDAAAVERLFAAHGAELAAVLVEAVAGNMGLVMPAPGFLEALRTACDRHGALLVVDEVMTGFRVAWGGAQRRFGVRPDITILGKVIGGGMPVAAYTARAELMDLVAPLGPVYQAGTLSGNPVGMAAGLATLRLCKQPGFYENLEARSAELRDGLLALGSEFDVPLAAAAIGGMAGFFFRATMPTNFAEARESDSELFPRFFHGLLDRGVWLPPSSFEALFVSSAHTRADIEFILEAARATLAEVRA